MVSINYRFNSDLSREEREKLKSYLGEKIKRWEKLFKNTDFPPRANVEIEFLPKKKRYRVEIQLDSSIGKVMGVCEKQNLNEGVDEVVEDVRRQLKRQKEKILTLRRRAGMSIKKLFSVHKSARFRLPRTVAIRKVPNWLKSRFSRKK